MLQHRDPQVLWFMAFLPLVIFFMVNPRTKKKKKKKSNGSIKYLEPNLIVAL